MPDLTSEALTEQYMQAMRRDDLIIRLDVNLFGGRPLLHLEAPGATPKSKNVKLAPLIVGDEGQTHADMLRQLAEAMDQARGE